MLPVVPITSVVKISFCKTLEFDSRNLEDHLFFMDARKDNTVIFLFASDFLEHFNRMCNRDFSCTKLSQ